MWTCLTVWAGGGEKNKQSNCIQGDIDRFYFLLCHMTEAACWACGISVRLFQDVRPSAICTRRAEIGLAILPYHLLCGHMGWGYRIECMLVRVYVGIILVYLCASCGLRPDLLSHLYALLVKRFLNTYSSLITVYQ